MDHITPPTERWPEGEDFPAFLTGIIHGSVVEVGCGVGRLARAFLPNDYLGLDICEQAVIEASHANPGYAFAHVRDIPELSPYDNVLAYTVLLHVPDDGIEGLVQKLCRLSGRVIIGEVMGRKWRREGDPPVFNREPVEYVTLFANENYRLAREHRIPIARYDDMITLLDFRAC